MDPIRAVQAGKGKQVNVGQQVQNNTVQAAPVQRGGGDGTRISAAAGDNSPAGSMPNLGWARQMGGGSGNSPFGVNSPFGQQMAGSRPRT